MPTVIRLYPAEIVGPGYLTPWWVWVLVVIFIIIIQVERCCYTCDYDDLLGCPACPNGYPCIFPCNDSC